MIIYNVTVNVDDSVHDQWLQWMKAKHIPDVIGTGHFISHRLCKLLGTEEQGTTYAVQYFAPSLTEFYMYDANHAPKLRQEVQNKFGDTIVSFRTLLEVVE
jgi:hypothetical protein